MVMNLREQFKKWITRQTIYEWYIKSVWNPAEGSVQKIIKNYAEKNNNVFFVQIGANDGYKNDPVYRFIRTYNWNGILVEPQRDVFEHKLKATYADQQGLEYANVAIGPEPQKRDLYKIAFSNARWATGLASFDRSNIEKHIDKGYIAKWAGREGVALPERRKDYIASETVKTITFEDLADRYGSDRLDAVFIDAEGFDYQILHSINLEKYHPNLLLFEELHISDEKRQQLYEKFSQLGYRLKKENRDVLAYKL